ncbi:MAG TPA: tRNA (adenosine(37)-N6)-threonylcarbamoyltransferase complex transferase subunit TsaD [Alphaproteobacteria bacterium]|jgi:N6-L-threonylcarbamoyladenine synthase
MLILGIETSCDETAAAVVNDGRAILSSRVLSQTLEHAPYGGIVPEIAARSHLDHLDRLVGEALAEAGVSLAELDGIAATGGPGLIGGVIVGITTAKALALVQRKPLIAVNHLEGHALTARLSDGLSFPYLLLLVTGGHCQLLVVEGVGRYKRLGTTIDDAIGEAFDKAAKMLGLGYPGGPEIERAAAESDAAARRRFPLPRPLAGRPGCDFSFSGLKTALRQTIERLGPDDLADGLPTRPVVAAIAGAFQDAVADVLADRAANALDMFLRAHPDPATRHLVVAGGVAANGALRARLTTLAGKRGVRLVAPPLALCTDNAAMIAWAGVERLRLGLRDPLDFAPRPRWPLDPTAPRAAGAGVKA